MQVIDDTGPTQVEEVLALAAVARPVAVPGAAVRQVMFHLHALAQRGATRRNAARPAGVCWRSRSSAKSCASGWMLTLRPCGLSVHCGRRGQTAQVWAGNCTTPPGTKDTWTWPGHWISPRAQSRWKAVVAKCGPWRTGHALQKMVGSGARCCTRVLLK